MPDYSKLIAANAANWARCEITPSRLKEAMATGARLAAADAKPRYQAVEAETDVPWEVVAVIAERESGADFARQLGQGDRLDHVSVHVPRGMGPYLTHEGDKPGADAWHRCAVDTLQNSPPFAARWRDWSPGGALALLTLYNGIGYELYHHESSPYVWGGTNVQTRGKYTGDGHYDASAWDGQLGCAAMLKAMMQVDPSITFAAAAELLQIGHAAGEK